MKKVNICGLPLNELKEQFKSEDIAPFRAAQVMEWLYKRAAADFSQMDNLPLSLREKLAMKYDLGLGSLVAQLTSKDGKTTKSLIEFADKMAVETVLMRQSYGNSICVSSQAGCAMGCSFCASTLHGVARNLSFGEIMAQALYNLRASKAPINNIVLMGSGEPLQNYDNVLSFIREVHEKYSLNIGYRNITLSTCGIVPRIYDLAQEDLPITLSISLHAPQDELRSELMPINRKYPLHDVLAVADYYAQKTKRRVTYEYILIDHINDNEEQIKALVSILRGKLANVNLIPVNPVLERGFNRPSNKRVQHFQQSLLKQHINATVRREMGADINAACGQLRNKYMQEKTKKS